MAGDPEVLQQLCSVLAQLCCRLDVVAFPFIGGTVPEGHQGQSIQGRRMPAMCRPCCSFLDSSCSTSSSAARAGMSHGAILARLKTGFHKLRIPWGHNADHQPVGGKFTCREHALAAGCVLASYTTRTYAPRFSFPCCAVLSQLLSLIASFLFKLCHSYQSIFP
jgi:hypothetical protein